ncbi:hypothetical protein [Mesorhizobium onobrychidis]|uniref:Uncharacterized protein n=1 Tax=Mesorhizobium onobrychidis TaxID=2775404 RepID=A0ABY5QR77_9HYPH|nr:hypothetical protein [Mesorhizobium onobrychidis]UVC13533.1 hypothetical protein IHQ72_22820 [Mesorhizobium onobrychidis]
MGFRAGSIQLVARGALPLLISHIGAIGASTGVPGWPRAWKRHDGQWRLAEFRDGYFLDQGVECLADALARFVHAAEPVLGTLQELARCSEVASHNTTRCLARRTDIVGALN